MDIGGGSMVKTIGWINAFLIATMASIYPIKVTYLKKVKKEGKEKSGKWKSRYQLIKKLHPRLGLGILVLGFYHGTQAFSLAVLHTGTLLLYTVLLMAIIAISGPRIKLFKKNWRIFHRAIGGIAILFLALHIFNRNLI